MIATGIGSHDQEKRFPREFPRGFAILELKERRKSPDMSHDKRHMTLILHSSAYIKTNSSNEHEKYNKFQRINKKLNHVGLPMLRQ